MQFWYRTFWGENGTLCFKRSRIDIEGQHSDDHIVRQISKGESFYEEELLNYLTIYGPHGGLYVDVGANIGNHSVFFGKFLADSLLCFEPSNALHVLLERNLRINNVRNYKIFTCALGASRKKGRLVLPDTSVANVGMTRVEEVPSGVGSGESLVEIRSLDDVIAEISVGTARAPVRLIKIDVEGMELEVLKGSEETLQQDKPHLVVEAATNVEKEKLDSYLDRFGYTSVRCFGATPTYHYINPDVHKLPSLSLMYRLVRRIKGVLGR